MGSQGPALPPVKSVMVYRNGDPFFPGRRFVVNQRQVANLESFLNEVTQDIRAPVAVRTLYTPCEGHRVHGLQDLRSGGQYVAAGFERFRKLDYSNTGLKPAANRSERAQARTVQRPNVSAKWRKAIHLPSIIHVFRNGDVLSPPLRFIIPRTMLLDLEQILTMVSEKASLRTGAVRRLCTLEGGAVSAGEELESGQYYVALGTERFKKLPYVELLVPKAPAGREHRNQYGDRRLPKRYENGKPVSVPQDRYSDSTLLGSPEADGRRVKSTGDEAGLLKKQGRAPKEEESLFFAKPAKVHKNRAPPRHTLPLRGNAHPSVFKGDVRKRRKEVQGAEEVAEDENTAVEIPVDQRVAETVEDEEPEKQRPETSRDSPHQQPASLQEQSSAGPRFEDGSETNRSTPSRYRDADGRGGSAVNEERREETTARNSGAGSTAGAERNSGAGSTAGAERGSRAGSTAGAERNSGAGSTAGAERSSRAGATAGRGSQDLKEETADGTLEDTSQAEQETTLPTSRAGSVSSLQGLQEAGNTRPASHLSVNELAA